MSFHPIENLVNFAHIINRRNETPFMKCYLPDEIIVHILEYIDIYLPSIIYKHIRPPTYHSALLYVVHLDVMIIIVSAKYVTSRPSLVEDYKIVIPCESTLSIERDGVLSGIFQCNGGYKNRRQFEELFLGRSPQISAVRFTHDGISIHRKRYGCNHADDEVDLLMNGWCNIIVDGPVAKTIKAHHRRKLTNFIRASASVFKRVKYI